MRRAGVALLGLLGCAGAPRRPPLMAAPLDARRLAGTWHVVATTFPMWTRGDRRAPSFTYARVRREGERVRMDDTVAYVEDGERGTIEGVDTQHAEVSTHFTWRGRGWLSFFTSDWDVVALDPDGRWAALTFSATIATPAGLDVIAREPTLDAEALASVIARLRGDAAVVPLLRGLVTLPTR